MPSKTFKASKIIAILSLVVFLSLAAFTQSRYRMAMLGQERHDDHQFEFWHDNETGQEMVCVYNGLATPACYLTGRTWK